MARAAVRGEHDSALPWSRKHVLPLMPRTGRTVLAVVSARIGSIADNKLGGWYGYRASKAALNMMVRTLAIEEKRRNDRAILVAPLTPARVDTDLSRPSRATSAGSLVRSRRAAAVQFLDVIDGLKVHPIPAAASSAMGRHARSP